MKKITTLILCFILHSVFQEALAHPGIGFVMDSKGNFYFTDLKQIWKQTPDGEKNIAVANVHSHELYIDKNDNLFGEHLWYDPAEEKFFNYQWCLKGTGDLIRISDTLETFAKPKNYSYTRDDSGNMYWYQSDANDTFNFVRRDTTGNELIMASGKFKDIRWVFCTPNGDVYFLDLDDLYKITPNNDFQLIAKSLCTGTLWTLFFGKQHSVFGVWFDSIGNIYAAVTEDRCIKKISPTGKVTIIYKSKKGSPTNGLFDSKGDLWILEDFGLIGYKTGVKKIEMTEISKGQIWFSNNLKYLFGLLGLVAVSFIFRQLIMNKRKLQRQL
jgi:hypothetical protein